MFIQDYPSATFDDTLNLCRFEPRARDLIGLLRAAFESPALARKDKRCNKLCAKSVFPPYLVHSALIKPHSHLARVFGVGVLDSIDLFFKKRGAFTVYLLCIQQCKVVGRNGDKSFQSTYFDEQ